MKNLILCVACCAVISGCATRAKNITPTYVSTAVYQPLSCSALSEEAVRLSQRASVATKQQDSAATGDAVKTGVGLVLFWPALLFNERDGMKAAELARLKGEMNAVEQVSASKGCNITFRKS